MPRERDNRILVDVAKSDKRLIAKAEALAQLAGALAALQSITDSEDSDVNLHNAKVHLSVAKHDLWLSMQREAGQ